MPSPADYPASSERSALSSGHALLLITATGLLGMAALLETAIHDHNALPGLGSHHHVPAAVHGLAIVSAVLSLWPALRNVWLTVRIRRLHWHLVVVAGVIAAIAAGQFILGSLAALLFSLGLFIWLRTTSANRSNRA
jgi:cation transport ATPase